MSNTTSSTSMTSKKLLLPVICGLAILCLTNIEHLVPIFDSGISSSEGSVSPVDAQMNVRSVQGVIMDDDDADADNETVDGGAEESHDDGNVPVCYKSPMLPKTMYSVIGHESSGTQFTTGIIKDALKLPVYREGSNSYGPSTRSLETAPVQAQHFSLPWGSVCTDPALGGKEPPIVDVVLPSQCTRVRSINPTEEVRQCCDAMASELLGVDYTDMAVKYPNRYNLDIVSHKEWWDAHGVEQWIIIVLRDTDISATARYKGHCRDRNLLAKEEETARNIIIDAINKYILDKDEKKVTSETYDYWHAERFQSNRHYNRRLSSEGNGHGLDASMIIPSKNRVVLVSYESMMHLGEVYVEMLYKTLGIETDYMPTFQNGNSKYVPSSPYRTMSSRTSSSYSSTHHRTSTNGRDPFSKRTTPGRSGD